MPRTILIVDDSAINRKIIINALKRDYETLEAGNGEEALALMHRHFRLLSAVLLDIVMPVMDGFDVLRQMRDNAALSQIPVIVITGSEDEDTRVKALSLGANDFVTKPYNPEIVKHCLRNNISLRETASIVNAIQKDKLTGIYNREFFFIKAGELIANHEPGYFIMACMDIDNFKLINDQLSPAEGDRILRHVGDYLRSLFDQVQGVCGRIAGDNFAALFPNDPKIVKWINESHEQRLLPRDMPIAINFSLGRYVVSDTSLPVSTIYDRAYIAKQSVKGRYDVHIGYFDQSMLESLLEEQQIVSEMSKALSQNQFEIWFQPQYNHATSALIGAEALVRWKHPTKGVVSPGAFIPVFERNGFIYELDKCVWEQTCRCLSKWLREGRSPLPVSVNISRYDIFRPDLVSCISGLVKKYDVPVDLLRLEITESAFAKSTRQIVRIVKELIALGFTVEIDDFGSGYSSLNTLKNVPAQILKLDMRFLSEDDDSERGGNILESIVRMAKWLGMSVIAEGVETVEQADFLKSIGCDYVQGYLYARPMPADDYEALCVGRGGEQRLITLETVDNLDNNAFWNPKSMDTLIFNCYVGGACIFEYRDGRIEMIRANDKYARVIGGEGMTAANALAIVWENHMDEAAAEATRQAIERAIQTKEDVTYEAAYHDLLGTQGLIYLRTTFRLIARTSDRYMLFGTNENITRQREAELLTLKTAEQLQAIMDGVDLGITATLIRNGHARFLFSNNRYYEILGYTREQYEREVSNPFTLIHPDDVRRMEVIAEQVNSTGEPTVTEYRALRRDGSVTWLQCALSSGRFSGVEETVQLTSFRPIDEERRAADALRDTDDLLRFLNETAHELLSQPDSDNGIRDTLRKLLRYFGGTSAYIFEVDRARGVANNTYEVYAPGADNLRVVIDSVPLDTLSNWMTAFERDPYIRIDDVSALDENRPDKALLLSGNIRSVIAVPLRRDGELLGFMGVDNPYKQYAHADRLAALGDYIAVMLTRRDLSATIQRDNERLQRLIDDIPGGYIRLLARPDGGFTPLYVNPVFAAMLGRDADALKAMYAKDPYADVHPDDLPIMRDTMDRLLERGEAQSPKYRLRTARGDYVWVHCFARKTVYESGDVYLNLYYSDATEQHRTENMQKELLDNLPCGAGLYTLREGVLSVIHLNHSFEEMLGRKGPVAERALHPDDDRIMRQKLTAALDKDGAFEGDVRMRHQSGQYLRFQMHARVMRQPCGLYTVYAIFLPVTDEGVVIRDLLPVVLEAMMATQNDLAFVKDRNLRYVCGSRSFARMTRVRDETRLAGLTDYDLFDKTLADRYVADDKRLFESGRSLIDYEEVIPSRDGEPRRAITSKYILYDSRGEAVGLYGSSRDVTEALARQSRLKLLTDSIPGGITAFEGAPGALRMTYYSDGFCRLLGYGTREEYEADKDLDVLSLVHPDDAAAMQAPIEALIERGEQMDATCRVRTRGGELKWLNIKAVRGERREGHMTVHAVLFDVTERQNAMERLRISEEEYRLAAQHGESTIGRYNVADGALTVPGKGSSIFASPVRYEDVLYSVADSGLISPETARDFIKLFEGIRGGKPSGQAVYQYSTQAGWRWIEAHYTTIFSDAGAPTSAVISFMDVTERREKEAVYKRWQQSLLDRNPDKYALLRGNISRNTPIALVEGGLLPSEENAPTYDGQIALYAKREVVQEDAEAFLAFLKSDTLIAKFHRGKRSDSMEYRQIVDEQGERWLRLTVDLVELPNSKDVEVYILLENIDESKRAELITLERAETDPLTGVLNRVTFAAKVDACTRALKPDERHALMMLDVDGFKLVNDAFGHAAGDQTLVDIAGALRAVLRRGDLLGRLGGDEFVIFLRDMRGDDIIVKKAQQICAAVQKMFNAQVRITASIGVAVCPRDGVEFITLYHKADAALYHVKGLGKNNYAFFRGEMPQDHPMTRDAEIMPLSQPVESKKRRLLIVDDNPVDSEILAHMFTDEFLVDRARDGATALVRLRHYGTAISVMLLDLMMPGMDGFAVLKKMRESAELQGVPVIVVSGSEEQAIGLKAIRMGASDFITKPVDQELLRVRVQSAISKAENERLRAKNSLLEYQNSEIVRYKTVLEHIDIFVVEHDWITGTFVYDPSMRDHVAGFYDARRLWHVLLADLVADTATVRRMQRLVHDVAEDRARDMDEITVMLKTPNHARHTFKLTVLKHANEFGLTDKLYLVFRDLDD